MRSNNDDAATRRFLVMGLCSALLHVGIAAIILSGIGSEKPVKVYSVELKYLEAIMEQAEDIEQAAAAPEQPEPVEMRKEPEKPAAIDLTGIVEPVLPKPEDRIEQDIENADIIETPVPPVENAIITPDGGLGSGADTEDGGGNSLLASGTERGWGGAESGEGWGGGSGSPGSGGGTGGGYGSGTGNSRGREGEAGAYFAGMPGITPPVYERTPQPSYPAASRSRGEQGEVLLRVEVMENGRVGQAEVEKSSGHARLDESALAAIRNWRFKPARKGREIVACWVNIPIKFALN